MRLPFLTLLWMLVLGSTGAPAASGPRLLLAEVPLTSEDTFDLRDYTSGDRSTPRTCTTPAGTLVSVEMAPALDGATAMIVTASNDGASRTFVLPNGAGVGRYTHACDTETDRFYVGQPVTGAVYGIDASTLLALGLGPAVVWKKTMTDFTAADLTPDAPPLARQGAVSALTAVVARHGHVMVEWLTHGLGYYQAVFDGAGNTVETLGPSSLMLRTNAPGPDWQLFYDDAPLLDPINYRVSRLFAASVGPESDAVRSAASVLAELSSTVHDGPTGPIATLDAPAPVAHMVALLTPNRTATRVAPEFCAQTPPRRARLWLGSTYDARMAAFAHFVLVSFAQDLRAEGYGGDPVVSWFDAEIAPNPPMRDVIARFDKDGDASYAAYQQALVEQAGPLLNELITRYSVRPPEEAGGEPPLRRSSSGTGADSEQ